MDTTTVWAQKVEIGGGECFRQRKLFWVLFRKSGGSHISACCTWVNAVHANSAVLQFLRECVCKPLDAYFRYSVSAPVGTTLAAYSTGSEQNRRILGLV